MEAKINADGEKNQSAGMSVEEAETDSRDSRLVIDSVPGPRRHPQHVAGALLNVRFDANGVSE